MTEASGEQQATAERPSAIEALRTKIGDLERKLSEIGARRTFNRETRAQQGLPLNTSHKTKIDDLRLESLRLSEESIDLQSWLETARADLAAAEHAELVAADVELARRRLRAAENVRRGGAALDQGFSAERFEGWNQLLDTLIATRLSCESAPPAPNGQQRRVFAVLALRSMIANVSLVAREFETVSPSQKTSFAKISADWATSSERSAREFLTRAGVELEAPQAAE
jgi:hypothetical protein